MRLRRLRRGRVGPAAQLVPALDEPTGATPPRHFSVLIVGSGFAGLGAAIQLDLAGRPDFLVIERGSEVGGTWRDNTYPGAACDVPSQLYSFSFAPNPNWSRTFSPQPEIQQYLRDTAARSGTLDRHLFNCELLAARWESAAKRWQVRTSKGTFTADFLVTAFGGLSEPRYPAVPGIEQFAGTIFHSARWRRDCDLADRQVAVIGTGASAIQLVPQIAAAAGHLDVYQRTAPWIMARGDRKFSRAERWAFRWVPGLQRLKRLLMLAGRDANSVAFCYAPRILQLVSARASAHRDRQITDPELRRRLTPSYLLGCKRVLLSDDFYPALAGESVELISEPITQVRADGIVTADGIVHPADVLILATGFRATDSPAADLIVGATGRSLGETWRTDGQQAYKGSTIAGFPNMLMLVGPNTGVGNTSMIFMIESQLRYLLDALRRMEHFGLATIEPTADAQRRFNVALQRRMAGTVWMTGCASWYLDGRGRNTTLWPRFGFLFRAATRRFDLDAYLVTPQSGEVDDGTWPIAGPALPTAKQSARKDVAKTANRLA
jgi:cation diffusion facilitator CzcD-associated flavoprotein CzcO